MSERLKVSDALHGRGDGLPVDNRAGAEVDRELEAVEQYAFEDFRLDFAHEADV